MVFYISGVRLGSHPGNALLLIKADLFDLPIFSTALCSIDGNKKFACFDIH
jgi:hypothetical protein